MPRKRRSLTEALSETPTIASRRAISRRAVARAKRQRAAADPPHAALSAYSDVMGTYTKRMEKLLERHVLSALPVLGSGEGLDLAAIDAGLAQLRLSAEQLAFSARPRAQVAARRASDHARRQVGRMLNVRLPLKDAKAAITVEAFADKAVVRLLAARDAQIAQIRKAVREQKEGESLRQKILDALWVTRNRGALIARDHVYGLHSEVIRDWAQTLGSRGYVWHTRRDELVRPGHAVLDGKSFAWNERPNTGHGEGTNLPGEAVNCRCTAIPLEALEEK